MEYQGEKQEADLERSLFRVVYVLKRALDDWGEEHIKTLNNPHLQATFMPFFMNIGLRGASNSDLAAMFRISKQGASRIVKGLEASGLVRAEKSDKDGRSFMLYLTEDGQRFYKKQLDIINDLKKDYIRLMGSKNYENTIDQLLKMIEYHNG
ncbi:MarR family winged helix-turn-helix transcriptional regulator [Mucilaginibacter paludis]|uniref:Regulatory protein MarR n=1 Tax=Mucilaginibacter paludis DSM 18603 TaxID=714943 RepID=H1Y5X2_9SPHI|nr:MarR family transcriptional regulator [Mucilaginibacter paludis]EHQ30394.1 regulatory protein MarR [Mucilaginibacter paludis DSM 18603]